MLKRTLLWSCGAIMAVTMAASAALAADSDILDARLSARGTAEELVNVTLPEGSTSLTWLVVIGLAIVGISVMFKNAKRTHLD